MAGSARMSLNLRIQKEGIQINRLLITLSLHTCKCAETHACKQYLGPVFNYQISVVNNSFQKIRFDFHSIIQTYICPYEAQHCITDITMFYIRSWLPVHFEMFVTVTSWWLITVTISQFRWDRASMKKELEFDHCVGLCNQGLVQIQCPWEFLCRIQTKRRGAFRHPKSKKLGTFLECHQSRIWHLLSYVKNHVLNHSIVF